MASHGQSAPEIASPMVLEEVPLSHTEVREDTPSEQVVGQSDRAKTTWAECIRPLLLDQLLLNSYIPPQGQALPMEEVLAPKLEGA